MGTALGEDDLSPAMVNGEMVKEFSYLGYKLSGDC